MKTSRRSVLAGMSSLPIAGFTGCTDDPPSEAGPTAAPDRSPEPPPWNPPGTEDEVAFAWGVQAGDASEEGVILSVRTLEAVVALTVVRGVGEDWEEDQVHADLVPVEGYLRIAVEGLTRETVYRYVFSSADGARRSRPGRFRTSIDGPRKIVFGATSCLGTENPQFPGLTGAAAADLDFFLMLGDLIYADGAVSIEDYRGVWDRQLSVPSVRALLASTSVVATWDDHEVANNWTEGDPFGTQDVVTPPQLAAGSAAFLEAIPQRIDSGGPRWRSIVWGDVLEVFVLDCRGERDWETHIVSDEQLAWIVDALHASSATFKIVLASVHVTDHFALLGLIEERDRWQGYPDQRGALLAAAEEVPGVLFVTGDMHYGAIQSVGAAGEPGDGLWEIAAGPSGSAIFPLREVADVGDGVPPQYAQVVQDWNWTRFEADPGLREIRVQLIDDRGEIAAEQTIRF